MRACTILIIALLAVPSLHAADPPRPNIILILADDMGFSDLGCYGGEIHTPHIDRLAKEGVRFAQFYNMARCCPTRAALLTGLYPHQAGMGAMNQDLGKPAYQGVLNDRCVTMAEVLKDSGYHTAMFGKWHLNHLTISGGGPRAKKLLNFEEEGDISPLKKNWPFNRGFEEHIGTIAGVDSYYDPYSLVHNGDVIRPPDKDFYYTDFITENAVKQIDRYAAQGGEGKPYFMYVAYTAPHWPMQAREADIAKYKETYTIGWDKIRQARFDRQTAIGLIDPKWGLSPRANYPRLSDGKSVLTAWDDAPEKEWQARRMAVYAAMIECMDRGVGQILDHLDSTAAAKNTVVIFLSDNGACAENVQPGWYDVPSKTRDGRPIHVGNDPKFMPGPEEAYQSYGPAWANASNTPFRRFKHWTEEGGISAPFIVRWPTVIKDGGRIEQHQVGHVIDLMPTVMAITGATYPKRYHDKDIPQEEGKSLVPAFSGQPIDRAGPLCWEHEGNRAVRLGDWKLLATHNEPWQLYHITEDRTESNNLASANPEKVNELKTLYTAWATRCGVEPWPVK